MEKKLLPLLTINVLILLSACASQNQGSLKKAVAETVKAKIHNKDYEIDIKWRSGFEYSLRHEYGYIHISGDTLISKMWYDDDNESDEIPGMPSKNQQLSVKKYRISDYTCTERRRGRIRVTFSIDRYSKYQKSLIPLRYQLEIRPSTWVHIIIDDLDDPSTNGILRL